MQEVQECAECGGKCEIVKRSGRTMRYRGDEYGVPADFPMRTCVECGDTWLSTEEVLRLGEIVERMRKDK